MRGEGWILCLCPANNKDQLFITAVDRFSGGKPRINNSQYVSPPESLSSLPVREVQHIREQLLLSASQPDTLIWSDYIWQWLDGSYSSFMSSSSVRSVLHFWTAPLEINVKMPFIINTGSSQHWAIYWHDFSRSTSICLFCVQSFFPWWWLTVVQR